MAANKPRVGECRVRARKGNLEAGLMCAIVAFERFDGAVWVTLRTMRVARGLIPRLLADLSQLHAEHEEQMQIVHRDRAAERDRASQQRNEGIES